MYFAVWAALAYVPSLILGKAVPLPTEHPADANQVEIFKPTKEELSTAYPEITFHNSTFNELSTDASDAIRNVGYRFAAGVVSVIGFWAVNGNSQVYTAAKSCRPQSEDSTALCWHNSGAAFVSHTMVFGGGFGVGYRLFSWLRRGGVLQVTNVPIPVRKMVKRDCPAYHQDGSLQYSFADDFALKLGYKDSCFKADDGELGYVSALVAMIMDGMIDPSTFASSTDFTIYETSSRQVLGRFRLVLDNNEDDFCTFDISGADSCTV